MEITDVIFLLLMLVIGIVLLVEKKMGYNNASPVKVLEMLKTGFEISPLSNWGIKYKSTMRNLSKSGFARFKMRGVVPTARDQLKASRGYDKLKDILIQTRLKLHGTVLSLCCGRGGWEQVVASLPEVHKIISYTLGKGPGHEGHETFTERPFPGRNKVDLHYGDARKIPVTPHDTLLFDGGESDNDPEREAKRFNDLFVDCVMKQINVRTTNFVLKVLTPWHPRTIEMLKSIQNITGKGCLVRSSHSRISTMELYFCSGEKTNVERDCRDLVLEAVEKGIIDKKYLPKHYGVGYEFYRESIPDEAELLQPLDMGKSIDQLGQQVYASRRNFAHWESKGVYPWGTEGSGANRINNIMWYMFGSLASIIPGTQNWKLTDTTPKGFMGVFNRKIDTSPKENHPHQARSHEIWLGLSDFYKKRNFRYKELDYDEVLMQSNKQGAAGRVDVGYDNISDFLKDPTWISQVENVRQSLLQGKPTHGVFNTIGKREKKKSTGLMGSRMVAFLPIPMRLLELKVFGCLQHLVKPTMNRFTVGGLSIIDLGTRLSHIWKESGTSSDIAGFDTRVSLRDLTEESQFLKRLGMGKIGENIYRLYAYPHILIPYVGPGNFVRSELLAGRGQRMSGTHPTYTMNTILRVVKALTHLSVATGIDLALVRKWTLEALEGVGQGKRFGMAISGDDESFTGDDDIVRKYSQHSRILDEMGYPRKDVSLESASTIVYKLRDVSFCSHNYEPVTYYDEKRDKRITKWMPTRDVSEILGKACIQTGGVIREKGDMAWAAAQALNLIVCYHHMRSVRMIGWMLRAVIPDNLELTPTGGFFRPTPWLTTGDVLEIVNRVHFGSGSAYPVKDFEVRSLKHLGYLKPERELAYDPDFHKGHRVAWRNKALNVVKKAIQHFGVEGHLEALHNWRTQFAEVD